MAIALKRAYYPPARAKILALQRAVLYMKQWFFFKSQDGPFLILCVVLYLHIGGVLSASKGLFDLMIWPHAVYTLSSVTPSGQYKYRTTHFLFWLLEDHWPCFLVDELSGLFVRKMKLHAESPVLHAKSSCILHAKKFLFYFTWPLIVTLLRV